MTDPVNPLPGGLVAWLSLLESRHGTAIDLGLDRVGQVWARLAGPMSSVVITVGGTNGKGSVCAYLEGILLEAGYRVGLYTSPHLLRFNERIRLNGKEVDDDSLIEALTVVEGARAGVALTYFEHATLAAMVLFRRQPLDVVILEVGLGGRLDAVNLFEPDCAVVVQVDLDHMEFLGRDREAIGREKAGIFRSARPAICADADPPASLLAHAEAIGAVLLRNGPDYQAERAEGSWLCRIGPRSYPALPHPVMKGSHQIDNAAAAIAALDALRIRLPVPMLAIRRGLVQASVPGRFQVIGIAPLRVLDVAHNPHAARALAGCLRQVSTPGRRLAVLALLADKDADGVIAPLVGLIDQWYLAGLAGPRGQSAERLAGYLQARGQAYAVYPDSVSAWQAACRAVGPADTIAAFGSFHTVAEVLAFEREKPNG